MSQPVTQFTSQVPSNKILPNGNESYVQLADGLGNFRSNRYFKFENFNVDGVTPLLNVGLGDGGYLFDSFTLTNSNTPDKIINIRSYERLSTDALVIAKSEPSGDNEHELLIINKGRVSVITSHDSARNKEVKYSVKPDSDGNFGSVELPNIGDCLVTGIGAGSYYVDTVECNFSGGDAENIGNGGDVIFTAGKGYRGNNPTSNGYMKFQSQWHTDKIKIGVDDFGKESIRGNFIISSNGYNYYMPKNKGTVDQAIVINKIDGNDIYLKWGN